MVNIATLSFAVAIAVAFTAYFISTLLESGAQAYRERFRPEESFLRPLNPSMGEKILFMPPEHFIILKITIALIGATLGYLAASFLEGPQKLLPILFLMVPCYFIPDVIRVKAREARLERFNLQFVEALRIISNCLQSNITFPESVRQVAKELPEPVAVEFGLVYSEYKLAIPMETALNNLCKRIPIKDLELFVASFNTVYSVSGRLKEICESSMKMIMHRLAVEEKVQSMTAEGKLQAAIMAGAPFFLVAALFFIDSSMVIPLFTTFTGFILLGIAVCLDFVGYLFIRRIINIEV